MDFGQSAESEVTPIAAACVAAQSAADLLVFMNGRLTTLAFMGNDAAQI